MTSSGGCLRDVEEEAARALEAWLPAGQRTGDELADLLAALVALRDTRDKAAETGGTLVRALRSWGMSWRAIADETGADVRTARRWAGEGQP